MKCHSRSERYERLMDLTVEIEGHVGTLEEALRRFTTTEILDGENKYHCLRWVFRTIFNGSKMVCLLVIEALIILMIHVEALDDSTSSAQTDRLCWTFIVPSSGKMMDCLIHVYLSIANLSINPNYWYKNFKVLVSFPS